MAPRSPTPRSGSFLPSFRLRPQWASRNGTPTNAQTPVANPRLDAHVNEVEEDDDSELNADREDRDEESDIEEEGLEGEENEDEREEEEGEEEEDEEGAVEEGPPGPTFEMYGRRSGIRLEPALALPDRGLSPSPPLEGPSRPRSPALSPRSSISSITNDVELELVREAVDYTGIEVGSKLTNRVIRKVPMEIDSQFDPNALGLKEIGNLASWTVSSCKPGCGVDALRDDDTGLFWQSDGPQPHHLNIHFSRLVSILSIRIFLDFEADESYTPTRITLLAGTGYHDLIPFAALNFEQPKGWLDVPLDHVGGGPEGKTLRCFLVQVRIVENHQNGKDTHVRGLKIYARDDRARVGLGGLLGNEKMEMKVLSLGKGQGNGMERSWLVEPDWMGEPELR